MKSNRTGAAGAQGPYAGFGSVRLKKSYALSRWAPILFAIGLTTLTLGYRLAPALARDQSQGASVGDSARPLPAKVGSTAPDFVFNGVDESTSQFGSLGATKGHPVWVNFFATWCPPCKAEMPEIERRYKAHRSDGFLVVGADMQESADLVRKFSLKYKLTFPLVIDAGSGASAYQVNAIPTSIFIDQSGVVRAIVRGQMSPAEMDTDVKMIHQ